MSSYQIGRVEGIWKSFVPPVQGGTFRPLPSEQDEVRDDLSSSSDSDFSTPVFDAVEDMTTRRRHAASGEATPTSSISSVDLTQFSERKPSHMDALTQEKIHLDLAKYPSLDPATQQDIIHKYRDLNERLKKERLYDCNYTAYAWECARYITLFALSMLSLRLGWYGTSGMFMGMFWYQLVFTAHDAGHMGITHNYTIDSTIGMIIANYLGGLSLCWWKRNHNVHHITTNSPEHDPDIQHMPFFMISHRFFGSLRSSYYNRVMTYDATARFMARAQKYMYYPILAFGRFNLYRLSMEYLVLGLGPRKGPAWWHRWFEIFGQLFFWTWFGYGIVYKSIPTASGRLAFILASHMITGPLHVQLTLSHFAMSTADHGVGESFPQKMLRTTMDVDCPEWLDWFHGGLQFQAIHHLFPRIPRHNLRRAQRLVLGFCKDVGIPYALYGFVDGNKEVIGRLGEVGRQASILAQCQKSIAESGDFGVH